MTSRVDIAPDGPTVRGDLLEAEVRYGVDGVEWQQPFTARLLGEAGLSALLRFAGLAFDRWPERPGWFVARPGNVPGA